MTGQVQRWPRLGTRQTNLRAWHEDCPELVLACYTISTPQNLEDAGIVSYVVPIG